MVLKDTGSRREFETGAVRDIDVEKGRCDLLPLDVISRIYYKDGNERVASILENIYDYINKGYPAYLHNAIETFIELSKKENTSFESVLLDVSKHFKDGCEKYGERNWEKGIPLHCYIDSAIRHLLKFVDGQTDEPHDRAFIWNILCCLWTQDHIPEMADLLWDKPVKSDV